MTVIELIRILDDMPHNSRVRIGLSNIEEIQDPNPQIEWNDDNGKYEVVL